MDCGLMIADLRFRARRFPFPPNVAGGTAVPSPGSGRAPAVRGPASTMTGETPVTPDHVVEQFRHLGLALGHLAGRPAAQGRRGRACPTFFGDGKPSPYDREKRRMSAPLRKSATWER